MLQEILILGLASATVSTTVGSSALFRPFRRWLAVKNTFLGELIGCPYCLGHWVAALLTATSFYGSVLTVWDYVVVWLAATAVSALVSGTLMRLMGE